MAGSSVRTIPQLRRRRRDSPRRGGVIVLSLLCIGVISLLLVSWNRSFGDGRRDVVRRVCAPGGRAGNPIRRKRARPLVVVSAGGSRSGSTILFNALRILLRIRDPNTISGWHADIRALYDRYGGNRDKAGENAEEILTAFRGVSTLLIKLHLVQEWTQLTGSVSMSPFVDAVFTTHRDVRDVVRSMRSMGWARVVSSVALSDPDFCMRPPRHRGRAVSGAEYGQKDTWVLQARGHIKCRQALLVSAGDKLRDDLHMESLIPLDEERAVRLLERLGKNLEYNYSREELVAAARELLLLEPPECVENSAPFLELNPVTHLHRGHVRSDTEGDGEASREGAKAIGEDAECRNWLTRHGYEVS